jgi:hypothetical protein
MAVAAVGVFAATAGAGRPSGGPVVTAAADLPPGHRLTAADLELTVMELPAPVAGHAFDRVDPVVDRVTLGPVGRGEIVQAAAVTDSPLVEVGHEIALLLPRGNVAAARLQTGDRVDVFATTPDRTRSVVRGALLVAVGAPAGGAIGQEREVEVVVTVPSPDAVAVVVHALRTAEVTVVRSTSADAGSDELLVESGPQQAAALPGE